MNPQTPKPATVRIIDGETFLCEVRPTRKERIDNQSLLRADEENRPLRILTSDTSLKEGDIVSMEDFDIVWQVFSLGKVWINVDENYATRLKNAGESVRQIAHPKPKISIND